MTPHEEMEEYDEKGSSYIVSHVVFSNGLRKDGPFGVIAHSEKWMTLEAEDDEGGYIFYMNTDHVAELQITLL